MQQTADGNVMTEVDVGALSLAPPGLHRGRGCAVARPAVMPTGLSFPRLPARTVATADFRS